MRQPHHDDVARGIIAIHHTCCRSAGRIGARGEHEHPSQRKATNTKRLRVVLAFPRLESSFQVNGLPLEVTRSVFTLKQSPSLMLVLHDDSFEATRPVARVLSSVLPRCPSLGENMRGVRLRGPLEELAACGHLEGD